MSEIKTDKIKSALNASKVQSRSGIQVYDSARATIQIPFEITHDGKTGIRKELKTGTSASPVSGIDGEALLSRGKGLSPTWGPIPTSTCPPVSENGLIFGAGSNAFGLLGKAYGNNGTSCFCYSSTSTTVPCSSAYAYNSNLSSFNGTTSTLIWKKIVVNGNTAAAITVDGALYVWGEASSGRIGNGYSQNSVYSGAAYDCPQKVGTLDDWEDVVTNYYNTIAIKKDGTMWVCGVNTNGFFGNGTRDGCPYGSICPKSAEFVRIETDSDWKSVNFSWYYVVTAIKTDGSAWIWGTLPSSSPQSTRYRPSKLSTSDSSPLWFTPQPINQDKDWVYVAAPLGIKTDGSLWGWGSDSALLGINDKRTDLGTGVYRAPFKISGPGYHAGGCPVCGNAKWKTITHYNSTVLGLQEDGSVWVWGDNSQGNRLGIGTTRSDGLPWSSSSAPRTTWEDGLYVVCPRKLDNEKYISISGENEGTWLVRSDGTLWGIGVVEYTINGVSQPQPNFLTDGTTIGTGALYYPYNPKWSRGIIWSKVQTSANYKTAVLGIGQEIVSAPVGTAVMWLRRDYTSLTNTPCSKNIVLANGSNEPSAPSGWKYCDGTNETNNMKTYMNPITKKLDWPPIDNNNGCGDSPENQNGTISGQITFIQKI